MSEIEAWTVRCQDTADGSGDFIVDFPPELFAIMGLSLGDLLTAEVIDGVIVLKPKSSTPTAPKR